MKYWTLWHFIFRIKGVVRLPKIKGVMINEQICLLSLFCMHMVTLGWYSVWCVQVSANLSLKKICLGRKTLISNFLLNKDCCIVIMLSYIFFLILTREFNICFSWTAHDVNVTCRELGFAGGVFNFFSWARNDSRFMLIFKPNCKGDESSLLDCPGSAKAKIGSRICGKD